MISFGVQTFTVREAQKKDIEKTYRRLSEMGVKSLEIARIDFSAENAEKIKEISDKYGVSPVSIQVKPKQVFADVDGVVSFCRTTGCKNVVISMLPFDCILGSDEKFYSFVHSLDAQCEIYEKKGITLAYHHHNWEYITLENGKRRMEELLSRTKKIKFVHDTYWTARCGIDPVRQIEAFGSRLGIHLRDLTFGRRILDVLPRDCAIGRGVIDFSSVLRAAERASAEYTVIEQNSDSPFEDIKFSLDTLNKLRSELYEK